MSTYSIHREEIFRQTGLVERPVILVCLQNPGDRKLILQYLSDRFEVIISEGEIGKQDFDLCILDRPTFEDHKQKLIDYKEDQEPLIVPYLLFVKGENWSKTIDPVWEVVDDVIPIPTPTPILVSRINAMLRLRKNSLELKKKNDQLSMYEQAINATNAGLLITDAREEDNPIIFANEGFEEMTGYSSNEVLGRNCRFLQKDDREQAALDDVRSFIAEGKEGHVPLRNYKKDGTPFWNELSIAPITDADGNVTHFVGIQNDVTELIETQEKLKKEKDRYRLLADNATDMVVRNKPDGTFTYVSPSSEKLTGYKPEELIGRSFYEFFHPDDLERLEETHEAFMNNPGIHKVSYRFKTKNGDWRWLESSVQAIRDTETGEVTEVQGSIRDISERKKYEKELESEKEFIKAAVENMPGIFFMLDEELNFIHWNKNLENELGYSSEDIRDMHPLNFFNEKDQDAIQNKIEQILQSGHSEVDVDVLSKSGESFRYYLIGSRLNRYGKEFIVGSGVNTTQRLEAEMKSEQQRLLLSAVINQTESIIYVKDKEGRYMLVNDGHLDLLGLSRDEVIGKTDKELFDTEFAREVMAHDEKVLKTGKTMEFEEQLEVDGKTRKFISIKNTLKGIPGFENCICGISTDITEREEAYHQLQERNKEKNCLYSIGSLNEQYQSIDKILKEAVSIIPGGFQYPEIAEAAIEYDGEIYTTAGFKHTKWGLIAESRHNKAKTVAIKVVYNKEMPQRDRSPFIKEERELIDAITDTLASQIERITSREKLIESEKRWEQLVQKNPGLVQIIDGDEIRFINPAGARLYGVDDADELIGKSWTEFVNFEEDDKKTVRQRIEKAMSGDLTPPKVYKAWTVDNKTEKFIELQSVPVHYKGKRVLMTVGQEVTERIQYEKDLKKTYEQLQQAQSIAGIGYWTHNIKDNQSEWSDQMYKIWEVSRETFTPNFESFLETIHPEDKKLIYKDHDEAFPGNDYHDTEHRILTPEGKVKWVLERIKLKRDEKGQPKMLEGIAQDITEQKEKEKVIRNALKEKEVLLAEIHHRVKNNLAVISGLLQIQRFSSEDESLNKALSDSEMRIKSMALIHEKLYRAESMSEIDFSNYIEDLLSTVKKIVRKGDRISVKLNCDSVNLNVNQAVPSALILNELVSNAIEHGFNDRDEGEITINLKENENRVYVKVSDNGVGLPEDFDPDNLQTMGFTIINTLLNQLNASFEVGNGKGASFCYSFDKRIVKGSSSNLV